MCFCFTIKFSLTLLNFGGYNLFLQPTKFAAYTRNPPLSTVRTLRHHDDRKITKSIAYNYKHL